MIDLHCHLLPGIDDGSPDLGVSLSMARMAVADGITHVACTPHITPGVYDNTGADIAARTADLAARLAAEGIELALWVGADVHVDPQLLPKLSRGVIPTLGNSRYFLLEPPHHVVPPRLPALVEGLVAAAYLPIITHPERLRWIESHYDLVQRLVRAGALIQLTAASITGGFGKRPLYWSERMLDEGIVDFVATDAHNVSGRPPILSAARDRLIQRVGEAEAMEMVYNRPARVLRNEAMPARPQLIAPQVGGREHERPRWVRGILNKLRGGK